MDFISIDESDTKSQNSREESYRKEIIHIYFCEYDYGKLNSIPVQKERKQIILEEVSSRFDSRLAYTELEVDSRLAFYFDDFQKLKQELMQMEFLSFNGEFFYFHPNHKE